MRRLRRPLRLLAAAGVLAALLAAAPPAAADVLVTRDGERLETLGPWEVKGRLVVFTTADGQFSSLRAADVDLEASREATRTAEEPPATADPEAHGEEREPRRRSSGRRITNADIGPGQGPPPPAVDESETDDGEGGDDGGEDAADRGEMQRELAVIGIERSFAPDGHAVVRGTVRNTAAEPAAGISLTIHLHNVDGGVSGTAEADLGARALQPGAETIFVAEFPDVFAYESLRLIPRATFLATTAADGSADASENGAEDDAGSS